MKRVSAAVLFTLFLPMGVAQAALVSTDSPLGPQTAVLDTNTGLEWLKLSTTANTTTNQVFEEMASGGRFAEFRYATIDELHCGLLAPNVGMTCDLPRFTSDVARTQAFLDIFGTGFRRGGLFAVDPPGGDPERRFGFTSSFFLFEGATFPVEFDSQQIRMSAEVLNTPISHWLVREGQAISEPSTIALVALGAMALIRRRSQR